jgi:hypothetical protein
VTAGVIETDRGDGLRRRHVEALEQFRNFVETEVLRDIRRRSVKGLS